MPLAAAVSGKATRMLGVWQGSAAQQAAEMVPDGVRVVSALHTISAASLTDLEHPLEQDVLVCGDSRADKREAARLIERIDGLRCVDCGRLEMSRITESLTALLIGVNSRYKVHAGIRLTGLPDPDLGVSARPGGARDVVVLAGGTGGAKLARGMADVVGAERLAAIANTGDDIEIYGAHVSPDPDLVSLLARRRDRRARLGPARGHLHRDGRAARARVGCVVQPRRPRPRVVHRARADARRGPLADGGARAS